MHTTPAPTWPQRPAFTEAQAAAVRRYEALSPAERDRARRLICLTGAPLGLAVAAIEATRPEPSTHAPQAQRSMP